MNKLQFHFLRHHGTRRDRGQSMIEMALTFPILLLVLAGTLEVGKYFNDYLTLLDATREAARFAADGDISQAIVPPYLPPPDQVPPRRIASCNADYYEQAACLLLQNMHGVRFDPTADDIVISAVTINSSGQVQWRFPYSCSAPYAVPLGYPQLCDSEVASRDQGWSFCRHITAHTENPSPVTDPVNYHGPCQQAASLFSKDHIEALVPGTTPGMGIVIVEIYHVHHQFLGLIPPGLPFLPQEVMMHAYTMMPVPSAAPPVLP